MSAPRRIVIVPRMKRTLCCLFFALSIIALNATDQQPVGELGPHWKGKQFQYVGEFFKNYIYLIAGEDGNFGGRLADEQYVADVFIMREDIQILFRDPKSGKFAILDPSDQATRAMTAGDWKFQDVPAESIPAKAWQRATNPKNYPGDLRKGRQQEWIYVDSSGEAKQRDSFYVGTEVKNDPKFGYSFVPLLAVNQQRTTFYLDPKNQKFAPVSADMFGTPLDEIKYRKMDEGGVAEAIWKAIREKLSK
jgi:hypothetical protein